jgi:hypothetical protein
MRWNKKRLIGLVTTLAVYAGVLWFLTKQDWPVGYCGAIWFCGLAAPVAIAFAWRPYKILAVILCVCLYTSAMPAQSPPPKKNLTGACVLAVIILGIGVVIIVSLKKLCNKCLPPPQSPAQPPPPPTSTNQPPHLTSLSGPEIQLQMPDDNLQCYDVSGYQLAHNDPNGYPYVFWFTGEVESSTNLEQWRTEGTINGWVSSTTVAMVISSGTSAVTNFANRFSGSISAPFESLTAEGDRKFFRMR